MTELDEGVEVAPLTVESCLRAIEKMARENQLLKEENEALRFLTDCVQKRQDELEAMLRP